MLLIKSAWGGRSLYHNFRPPSSAEYPAPEKDGDMGFHYAEVLRHVNEITGNLETHFPDYAGAGFEIIGLGWHQGWNDRIDANAVNAYEENLVHFVNDIRNDLEIEGLPVVIANTGMGGWDIKGSYKERVEKLMEAQLALADPQKHPEFKGTVAGVETRGFQRTADESPSKQEFHWMRNWETYFLIGKGMGDSMVGLLDDAAGPAGTRGIIELAAVERPEEAVQLVGADGHVMIPEGDGGGGWVFEDGVLTASPGWDSVITPESYQDFRLHLEFNVNHVPEATEPEKNGNSGVYIQQRYEV